VTGGQASASGFEEYQISGWVCNKKQESTFDPQGVMVGVVRSQITL